MSGRNGAMLSTVAMRRLTKELEEWKGGTTPVPGMEVQVADRLDEWLVKVTGADNTVYAREEYILRFFFSPDYPIEPPEVVFLAPTPRHPHVYTNGHSASKPERLCRRKGETEAGGISEARISHCAF
uniref:UBC core domain-containing protein n=1 Tax=Compsopogon caeruleus TaxID=31354 RepID=A0A7S1XGE5_9RHOD|mmetsp:Transcript_6789/g.13861  ORF Transcript_6789/g.13861 Transcript_6789/m.13861 type:complete len:127 (+) Transcript_6789:79-459(+)